MMLTNDPNMSIHFADLENGIKEEFNNFYQYITECNTFNDAVQEKFNRLKTALKQSESRENLLKGKIDEEMKRNRKCEKESIDLIAELKETYDRNIIKLGQHHQKQISNLFEQHKSEVQKWRSRYEKLKFEKKIQSIESGDPSPEQLLLKEKLEKVNNELILLRSKNDSFEQDLSKAKMEKKSLHEELQTAQKKFKKDLSTKDEEVSKLNFKIKEVESKLKNKDEVIKENKEKAKELELKIKHQEEIIQVKSKELKAKEAELRDLKREFENSTRNNNKDENKSKEDAIISNEMSDAELKEKFLHVKAELSVATRDLDRKTEISRYLRLELKDAQEKIANFEKQIAQEREVCKTHLEQIEEYTSDINDKCGTIEKKDNEITELKHLADEHNRKMRLKQKELNDLKQTEKKWKDKCMEFEKKHQMILSEIETIKRKNAAQKIELSRKDIDITKLTAEKDRIQYLYDALKKLSEDLDGQLTAYNKKYTEASSAKKTLLKQKTSVDDEMSTLRNELYSYKEQVKMLKDEITQLKALLKDKEEHFNRSLASEVNKYNNLKYELELQLNKCENFQAQVDFLSDACEDSNQKLESINVELQEAHVEIHSLKEEASKHITNIGNLKKLNFQLEHELTESQDVVEILRQEFEDLKQEIETKEGELFENKIRYGETVSQQLKLIDYLKDKAEQKKKFIFNPKFFSDNGDKKSHEELQKQYKTEKMKNIHLNEQLQKTLQQLEENVNTVQQLNNEVHELKLELSQKRQTLYSTGSHKLPHIFTPTKVKLSILCVSCAKQIFFNQKAKKCRNCEATVHMSCSLIDNCGMPVDIVRQAIYQSEYSQNSDNDPTESDNVEPSAPDISSTSSFEEFRAELEMNNLYSRTYKK